MNSNSVIPPLLVAQEDALSKLNIVLLDEFKILKSRDRSLLEKNALLKEQVLVEISRVDKSINETITEAEKAQGISAEEQDQLSQHKIKVKELLQTCKSQNEVNGQIINSSQIAINRFKNILQKTLTNQTTTYDNKGLTNLNVSSIGVKA